MRILGIDPGSSLIGWGSLNADGKNYAVQDYGAFRTAPNIHNRDRVKDVFDFFSKLIKKLDPDCVAIEQLFFFKNAKTVMAVSEIRGVLLLAAAMSGVPVREFTPLQVKQAVTGYGRADKQQVQSMVKLILGLKTTPKPDDVADALAIAICAANSQ
jgi:crossover junction endodeoxyribonuclease RuvC